MGIPTTYFTKPLTSNPVKNDSATMLNAGDTNSSVNNLSLIERNTPQTKYGSKLGLAVSPVASGNIGTAKTISGGRFSNLEEGNYIGKRYTSTIAGTSSSLLRSGAADVAGGKRGKTAYGGERRLHITSWDAVTGAATKGGNAGDLIPASGFDGVTGFRADHANSFSSTDLVPGELTFHTGKLANPTNVDYASKTSP